MRDRPRVGEILVAAGIIDEMQLNAALGEQQRWGKRLGVTLIKMGMVEEGHLIRALAKQLDLPVATLAGKRIPPEIVALVPARIASEHGVMPLFTKGQGPNAQLFLGMEDPSNLAVLDDVSFRTGMEIRPVMIGPTELGEAIDRYYHGRNGGAPQVDPFRGGDTMNPASLRVVTDASPQPGTAPVDPSIEHEIGNAAAPQPTAPASTPQPARIDPPAEPLELTEEAEPPMPVEAAASATDTPAPALSLPPIDPVEFEHLQDEVTALKRMVARLHDDAERAIDETERTRVVAKALTQLLIDGGHVSLEALQERILELKQQGAHTGRAADDPETAAKSSES